MGVTSHSALARWYGDQNLVFLAPSLLNWMRMPGKYQIRMRTKSKESLWEESLCIGTFNEAGKSKDGKEGEDVGGVHMERCVHCLAACR